MVNEDYVPDDVEDAVIEVLRREGRANPFLIRERTEELSRQQINNALRNLTAAGWVEKVTRGLYDYVDDPRLEQDHDDTSTTPSPDIGTPERTEKHDRVAELVDQWQPGEQVKTSRARSDAKEALAWMRRSDGPQQKSDFLEAAEKYQFYYSPSTLWGKVVQPVLSYLEEQGVVKFTPNVGYQFVD